MTHYLSASATNYLSATAIHYLLAIVTHFLVSNSNRLPVSNSSTQYLRQLSMPVGNNAYLSAKWQHIPVSSTSMSATHYLSATGLFSLTLYVVYLNRFCNVMCCACLCFCDACSKCHMSNFSDEVIKWSWISDIEQQHVQLYTRATMYQQLAHLHVGDIHMSTKTTHTGQPQQHIHVSNIYAYSCQAAY